MGATTQTGIPIEDCTECGTVHPVTRRHCAGCGRATVFLTSGALCINCREAVSQ